MITAVPTDRTRSAPDGGPADDDAPGNAPSDASGPSGTEPIGETSSRSFHVRLDNFDGPFDLLLQLIAAQRMDITEVALHRVTDEFIAHIRGLGSEWDLGQATEFLVVAATLLDLKAARLLPDGDVDDPADIALLEQRDLLFARLLAYRAYQQVAALFAELSASALRRYPRAVTLEERYLNLLPDVTIGLDPVAFAELATSVFAPKPPPPAVSLTHVHASPESVADHTMRMVEMLSAAGNLTFSELVAECTTTMQVIARFLGLLHLYRTAAVAFEQAEPLGVLSVQWTGAAEGDGRAVLARAQVDEDEYA